MKRAILLLAFAASLWATDHTWLATPGTQKCRITGTTNASPSVITCAATHDFQVGDAVVITNVQGNYGINGLWLVNSVPTSSTLTVKTVSGTPVAATGAWHSPYNEWGAAFDYQYGYVNHRSLYDLTPHPRGRFFDGPSGALTAALKDTAGRADPSGIQYQALAAAASSATSTLTYLQNNLSTGVIAAAIKCLVDSCTSGALYDAARWPVLNPNANFGYGYGAVNPGGMGCNPAVQMCGDAYDYMSGVATAILPGLVSHEAMWSTFSSGEKQAFANFVLNDFSQAQGGLGIAGDLTTGCTPQPTGPVTGITVTDASNTTPIVITAANTLSNGAWISIQNVTGNTAANGTFQLTAVSGSGFTLIGSAGNGAYAGGGSAISPVVVSGNQCGVTNYYKHHVVGILNNLDYYPTNGGITGSSNNNQGLTGAYGFMAGALALVGDESSDPLVDRAAILACEMSAMMIDVIYPNYFNGWAVGNANDYYDTGRQHWFMPQLLATIQNSVVGYPSLAGSASDDIIYSYIYYALPYRPIEGPHYGQATGYGVYLDEGGGVQAIPSNCLLSLSTSAACQYGLYWMQNIYNAPDSSPGGSYIWSVNGIATDHNHGVVGAYYAGIDPAITPLNINTLPKQRRFTPDNSAQCIVLGLDCDLQPFLSGSVVSRTGWTLGPSSTDTLLYVGGHAFTVDGHGTYANNAATVQVYKSSGLLGPDGASAVSNPNIGGGDIPWQGNSHIQLAGTDVAYAASGGGCSVSPPYSYLSLSHWAGGKTGPASDDYMYADWDISLLYCAARGVTRANKSVLHFKRSSAQDYIVEHFDGATSAPTSWRQWVQYRLKQDQAATTYSPGITVGTKKVSLSDTVTGAKIQSVYLDITGNSNNVYFADDGDSYNCGTGCTSTGATNRVEFGSSTDGSTLGDVSNAEWAIVHAPGASSAIDGITSVLGCIGTGATCKVVQIADASNPDVAILARQGGTLTNATFTTTFSGTGQYIVTGLAAGTYTPTIGGVAVSTCNGESVPCTVSNGDNSLEFTGAAGAVEIDGSAPPVLTGNSLVNGSGKVGGKGTIK